MESANGQLGGDDFGQALHAMADHATLDQQFWSCPGSAGFHVRGRGYMKASSLIGVQGSSFIGLPV